MKKYNNSPGGRVLNFIRELSNHNNREWFAEHKADYEEAKALLNRWCKTLFFVYPLSTRV